MANRLLELLRRPHLVGDGAMGTMLQQAGLFVGLCPEALNLTHREGVQQIHRAYLDAGADLVETNSFGGTRLKLAEAGLADKAYDLNFAAANLAREVAGDRVVAGSIGPIGQLIEPYGTIPYEDAVRNFRELAQALADGGADAIIVETMYDLEEVKAAIEGVRTGPNLPLICTMTFDQHLHTMFGVSPARAVTTLQELGVVLIGANCGTGPEEMIEVVRQMLAASPAANLIIQPNAGLPITSEDGTVSYPMGPTEMAAFAEQFKAMGVKAIGSCCGSTPEHTRKIAAVVKGG